MKNNLEITFFLEIDLLDFTQFSEFHLFIRYFILN